MNAIYHHVKALSTSVDNMSDGNFPRWLKRQLDRREWTQAELARRLGTGSGVVSHWVRGQRVPDPSSVDKLADILGVDRDLVLALAGHRPADTELDPDDPAAAICALVRQIEWNDERAETITATLERFRKFDRQRAEKDKER